MWQSLAWPGMEHLDLLTGPGGIEADGIVLAMDEAPLRLAYRLRCDPDWVTRRLTVEAAGSPTGVDLVSDGAGRWSDGAGRPRDDLDGCIDVDIAATPFTNTLPIRRLGLRPGEVRDLRMAYVTVPGLAAHAADQRYTCLELTSAGGVYRYESGSFEAEIRVDEDGFVVDYPGLWRRVEAAERA
jgi:hypothetical protein